ncbi:MAG TPA: PfkB family carbohydrate kinase [Planctomycetota bacterium]|nr:PfkB family carbohydrate kinase [Planctomycetota bacterium]
MELTDKSARILAEIAEQTNGPRKIAFVSGNFNVVHPGHLRLLQLAAECGDFLVVGVNADSQPSVTVPAHMRLEGVRAISIVDYSFLLEEPPAAFIRRLRPAVVLKGKEFETQDNAERKEVESYGGALVFGSGEVRFSSLDLLRREFFQVEASTIHKPSEYLARHGFDFGDLIKVVKRFTDLRVVVIGDIIVDEYIDCTPLGMSREDPTLVVTPLQTKRFVGGAGIVAAHAAGLGAQVRYFGVVGRDSMADFARNELDVSKVKATFIVDDSRPTTLKQRYRAQERTLLRISHLRERSIGIRHCDALARDVESVLDGTDLVIFSDFNYGCLPQKLVDRISESCARRGVAMTADSQTSSQIGDVTRFKGMRLITPTEHEARVALHDSESGLVVLTSKLCETARADHVFLKLGAEGLLIFGREKRSEEFVADQLPAFNTAPRDVAGAGDSLLTCSSLALAADADFWQSAYLGSLAAAWQVGRIGNSPLSADQILEELQL